MEIDTRVIGRRIRQRRQEKNLKQKDIAELLDVSNNHISSIENGKVVPSLEMLMNLCNLLEVSPDYLLIGVMHRNCIPQNVCEKLLLCNEDDQQLISKMVDLFVERNGIPDDYRMKH